MSAPAPGRRAAAIAALVWIVAVHASLWWIEHRPEPRRLWGDERTYLRWAGELAAGGGWRPDPPLWPPLYPHLLAPLVGPRDAGDALGAGGPARLGGGARAAVAAVQTALLAAAALALRGIGRALGAPTPAPELAAAAMLGFPPLVAYVHYLWPEILHLALLLFAVWVLVGRRRGAGWLIALGLALGLAAVAKSLLGPVLPLLLLPLVFERDGFERSGPDGAAPGSRRRDLIRGAGRAALAAAACAAVLAPAAIADHARLGEPAARGTALFNLWVGLDDRSHSDADPAVEESLRRYRAAAPDAAGRREFLEREIAATVRERGWPALLLGQLGRQYSRLFDRDGFLTAQLPGGAIHERGVGYRRPPPALAAALRGSSWGLWAAVLALAPLGLALGSPLASPRPRWRWRWLPVAFVAYNLGIFLVLHVKTRYRVQLEPFLLLWAAVAAVWLARRWRARRSERGEDGAGEAAPDPGPGPAALAAAAAGSALLLWLAFGG